MAKRSIIRYGDRTTHGGTVISADTTYTIDGKPVARVGDMVACRRCRGSFAIVTGALDVWSGQKIARQDDITACGAKLIASQSAATIDDGSDGSTSIAAASALLPQSTSDFPDGDEPHAIRFQALDPETGKPAAKCVYILTRENGAQHGGITDLDGLTEVIETTRPEQIAVHFMFKLPKGDNIERKDLTE